MFVYICVGAQEYRHLQQIVSGVKRAFARKVERSSFVGLFCLVDPPVCGVYQDVW